MIISISGDLGSGKSTVAQIIAKNLSLKHYSSGDLFRHIAKEKGITIEELLKIGEGSDALDIEIDQYVEKLGQTEDNFIIDSRLAWHFIPQSFKVFLKVDEIVGAQRIIDQQRAEEQAATVEEMVNKNKQRRLSEIKRYKEYYNLDLSDIDQYDLIINTSSIPAEEVAQKVLQSLPK